MYGTRDSRDLSEGGSGRGRKEIGGRPRQICRRERKGLATLTKLNDANTPAVKGENASMGRSVI